MRGWGLAPPPFSRPRTSMSIAYWCLLAGGLFPYLYVGIAKANSAYDNADPRRLDQYVGLAQRAHAAHHNSFEAFSLSSPSPSSSRAMGRRRRRSDRWTRSLSSGSFCGSPTSPPIWASKLRCAAWSGASPSLSVSRSSPSRRGTRDFGCISRYLERLGLRGSSLERHDARRDADDRPGDGRLARACRRPEPETGDAARARRQRGTHRRGGRPPRRATRPARASAGSAEAADGADPSRRPISSMSA